MANCCTACKVEFRVEDIVVCCEVFCENLPQFHAKCVGLSYDEGCACLHENIFWMCDACRVRVENGRLRETTNTKKSSDFATKTEVNALKVEVERISQIVSEMSSISTKTEEISMRRQSGFEESPLSSTMFPATDQMSRASNDTRLELYVSNIATDVSENEVVQMVCESLGTKEVFGIKCLVGSGTIISTLDYVSYKITVGAKFRSCALRSSTWPDGIRCREFRNTSKTTWRPSNRSAIQTVQ